LSSKTWLGVIYLKDEGGYELVLNALNHYKKRISTIGSTPGLQDSAGMFVQILQQEAMKTKPLIDAAIQKINQGLNDSNALNQVQNDIPLIKKALACYEADIGKAIDPNDQYYSQLLGNSTNPKEEIPKIKQALEKISQFS